MARSIELRQAGSQRRWLLILITVVSLIAAACGVPDDVALDTDEVTLDTLTPVEPAEAEETTSTSTTDAVENGDEAEVERTTTTETEQDPDADVVEEEPTAEETTTTENVRVEESEQGSTTEAPQTTAEAPATTTEAPATTSSGARLLNQIDLDLEVIASLTSPVAFAARPGTSDIFIGEQQGRVVRLPGGTAAGADTPLDIRGSVSLGNEQGLLGLAFSPDGGRLYTNHTNASGSTIITRYTMSGDIATAPEVLMTIEQPFGNHNGGQLAFGPDRFLYIGMGDGGSSGDPEGNGQNPNSLHGSILRIDVSGASGYTIPPGNPFAEGGGAPEVFIWGIRNAWRFGFDQASGDLWIGDVGQDRMEEVTVLRSGTASGANLGWNLTEGTESFRGLAAPAGHVAPIITYAHGSGRCSITGGEVYRGSQIAGLAGTYLYGDFCTGEVFGYRANAAGSSERLELSTIDQLTSFGIGLDGEIYILSRAGGVFKLVEN